MSFGIAIFVTLSFVSCVIGISDIICDHVEHTVDTLADVAYKQLFGVTIQSNYPEWYRGGMQLFAFEYLGARWDTRDISWGIEEESETLNRRTVIAAAGDAFGKWGAVSSLRFTGPVKKPDIKIKFVPYVRGDNLCATEYVGDGHFEDDVFIVGDDGARIRIKDTANWTDPDGEWFCNIHIVLLHEIGHALGLDDSKVTAAVMSREHQHAGVKTDFDLHKDDIRGIQSLYGPPSSREALRGSVSSRAPARELVPWRAPARELVPSRAPARGSASVMKPSSEPWSLRTLFGGRPQPSYTPVRDRNDNSRPRQYGAQNDGFHPRGL